MGCTATTFVAAFAAINSNFAEAAAEAMAHLSFAAERAAKKAQGYGSFAMHLLDEIGA